MSALLKSRNILSIILTLLGMTYPVLVYFCTANLSFRFISLCIGFFLLGGLFLQRNSLQNTGALVLMLIATSGCMTGAFFNHPGFVLYLPALFSLSLFISFAYTLLYPPSIIEVFARMLIPDRSREEIAYCRSVTLMWVLFFMCSGAMAVFTACCTSLATWSLYNGFLSYVAIGILFAAELCYRYWRFRRYAGLRTDVIFKRLFPPKE